MEEYYTTGGCRAHCKSRMLFLAAALYNFAMAVFFVFMTGGIKTFAHAQFGAALLVVFALMFCCLAACPVKFKSLIPFVILRNLAYCAFAGWYSDAAFNVPFASETPMPAANLTLYAKWEEEEPEAI